MRVLMTTDTVGGVWTFTKELAIGLLRTGHAVALASFGRAPSKEQTLWCTHLNVEFGSAFLHTNSCVSLEWMEENHTAYDNAELALLRMADEFRPDLFHANQYCFGRLPLNVPKLITAHSDVLSWAAACRPEGLDPSPWLDRYKSLVERGLAAADALVAPTQSMLCALNANFFVPPANYVIPNGRSVPICSQHHIERVMQAVTVGRLWDEAKNIAMLSNLNAPFPVFAAGEQHYGNAAVPERLGCVRLMGPMEEWEMFDFYFRSSLYLATSIYEPFGLAPLEAALCGCAVIANDISSLREVWGVGAVYFRNIEDLTGICEEMNTSADTLQDAQRRSYGRALELSAERMTETYLALYMKLILSEPKSCARELTTLAC